MKKIFLLKKNKSLLYFFHKKKLVKYIKIFLHKKKKKNSNMVMSVTKISQNTKKKSFLSIEKNVAELEKMPNYNDLEYKDVLKYQV